MFSINEKKIYIILFAVLTIVLLFVGCSDNNEYNVDGNNGALYGPCIFYNGNQYVTPPYENISYELPEDVNYWGTSFQYGSEQYINGVLVCDVHNLNTNENVKITCINGGLEFYKSTDEKKVYTKSKAPDDSDAVPYYSCYVMVEN